LSRWTESIVAVAGTATVIFVVGNKLDLRDENDTRMVTYEEGLEWAQRNSYRFFETSAKTGQGIAVVFQALAEAVSRRPRKGTRDQELVPEAGGGCC
jgi:GTPase SAR1 family protein